MKRILLGILLLGALLVVASSALHPGRAQRLERLSASKSRLDALMRETDRKNELLTVELKGLESGPQGWQALARKEYGMLLRGEVVFRFPPDPTPSRAPEPAPTTP
jgi:cell division protein FtsB